MPKNFKNLFGLIKEKAVPPIDAVNEATREGLPKAYIPKFIYKPPFGYPRFVDLPMIRRLAAMPYVEMCISTIVDETSSVPWDITVKEGIEPTPEHEKQIKHVKGLYDNPNTNKESFDEIRRRYIRDILEVDAGILIKMFNMKLEMVEMMARDGATFTKNPDIYGRIVDRDDVIIDPNIAQTSKEMQLMEPGWITAADAREKAAYFQYGWISGARPVPFGKKEIIWFERNPRTDSIYGRSPIEVLAQSIQTLIYAIEHNLEYFSDNSIPKGVIGLEGADAEAIKAFKDQWEEQQRKKDSAGNWKKKFHHVPIVGKTPIFTRLQFTNAELELIESQKWWAKMVWACFGVTATELGYTEDAKGLANQIVQSNIFRKRAINPILRLEEYKHNHEIISEFEYPDIEFKFLMFDVEEETKKAGLYKIQLDAGYKTVNEIRREEGMDEVEDGDEIGKKKNEFWNGNPFEQGQGKREEESEDQSKKPGEKKKNEEKAELKYKYIRRTGSPGHYQYWYRDPRGKLVAGKKPDKQKAEFHNISDVREEIREMIENPKYNIPELSDKIVEQIDEIAGELIQDVKEDDGPAAASIEKMKIEKMVSFLERYRNVSNLNDKQVNDLFQETARRAQHIKETDDLYQRLDTKLAQEKFDKVLESIDKAKKSESRLDSVLAIDRFVYSVHQDFPESMLPRGFDISDPLLAAGIVIPYLDYARGKEEKSIEGKPGMGHSDKWWEMYHALRKQGHSKESAAKITPSKIKEKALQTQDNPLILRENEIIEEDRLEKSIVYLMKQNEKKIKELIEKEMGKDKLMDIKSVDDIAKRIKELINFMGLKTISDAVIKNTFVEGWDDAEKQLQKNILVNKDAIIFIQDYTFNNIKGMTTEIMQDLRQELERGIMAGEGIVKLKERVGKVFDVGEVRAAAIAKTETNRAEGQGRLLAWKSSGETDYMKKWMTHFDKKTSPICKRLNGQIVGINENFKDKQTGWSGPTHPAHVNCRSTVIYVHKDDL